jgi:hypothetical protein
VAAYTSDVNLLIELPDNLPSAVDTLAERLAYIQLAGSLVDALVGSRYPAGDSGQKFPDITDSPPTPSLIELATRKLAAGTICSAIGVAGRDGGDIAQALCTEATDLLRQIREGELAIVDQDGTDYATATQISSTTEGTASTFGLGRYDTDGELLDETAGSLDDF